MEKIIENIFENHYKKVLLIPIAIIIISLIIIGAHYASTGDFIKKSVSIEGGTSITIVSDVALTNAELESHLRSKFSNKEINVRELTKSAQKIGFIIESDEQDRKEIDNIILAINEKVPMNDNYSVEQMGSTLGESFFKEVFIAILIAFLFMSIVVFITFKVPIPSLMVISCAVADIVATVAATIVLDIKISSAGVAAFLMLVGYSVDTDILLTTKVLKRKEGSVFQRTMSAMKTGMVMTITSLIATLVGFFLTQSEVLKQILLIITIGLIFDLIFTWLQNTTLLKWYIDSKQKKV